MPLVDIEVGLDESERAIQDTAHKFAEEVLRPAGRELDQLADPSAVSAAGSPLWKVFEKHRELGLAELDTVGGDLSPVQRARVRAILNEELGWGDSGLAISLGVAGFHRLFAQMSGRPALIERFGGADNVDIGCWAVTEPDHGSDTLAVTEPHFRSPELRANCIATPDGDAYVIRGQKSAWVSNGTIATVAALFCTIDPAEGFKGGGVCLVPLDLPGVSRGKPLDKLGQRALNQGEIFFDDVRVPADYMVIGKEAYATVVETVLTMANAAMGTIFVGVARAALEHAIDYAKQRVQGGVPIFEHQSVKARLFRMFAQVEAARSLARRVLSYNSTSPPLVQYSIASKVFCTNTAFEVASGAVQTLGGNGLSREYPVEKLLRDARASMIEDGCNDLLSLVGASKL
ncbi:MAG: acyl-CoA/acyl-ACP dehydrogenase [Deltaproteobacteria bacterium]|nr:MAG: acyl-CoA/acyl-ACP dehydrogenase [Deltaproteobacteria bacterium]